LLDDEASIFYVEQASALCDGASLLGHDAQLEPERSRARFDRLARDLRGRSGRAKYIDQADLFGNLGERSVDTFAENRLGLRVDRDDAPSMLLHVGRDIVGRLGRGVARTDDRNRVVGPQNTFDNGVGIVHRSTLISVGAASIGEAASRYSLRPGRAHCLVSRMVGSSPDGCTYYLVAQITMTTYDQLANGGTSVESIYEAARQACLCVVYEAVDAVSNVAVVESFAITDDIPVEYRPPSPAIAFAVASDWDE
jgi:hypothetical protein